MRYLQFAVVALTNSQTFTHVLNMKFNEMKFWLLDHIFQLYFEYDIDNKNIINYIPMNHSAVNAIGVQRKGNHLKLVTFVTTLNFFPF